MHEGRSKPPSPQTQVPAKPSVTSNETPPDVTTFRQDLTTSQMGHGFHGSTRIWTLGQKSFKSENRHVQTTDNNGSVAHSIKCDGHCVLCDDLSDLCVKKRQNEQRRILAKITTSAISALSAVKLPLSRSRRRQTPPRFYPCKPYKPLRPRFRYPIEHRGPTVLRVAHQVPMG